MPKRTILSIPLNAVNDKAIIDLLYHVPERDVARKVRELIHAGIAATTPTTGFTVARGSALVLTKSVVIKSSNDTPDELTYVDPE